MKKKKLISPDNAFAVLDNIRDPVFIHDANFRLIFVNQSYLKYAGLPKDKVLNQKYYEVFPKRKAPLRGCLKALKTKKEEHDSFELPDGSFFVSRSYPVFDANNNYLYSVHILEDSSSLHHLKKLVSEDEKKYYAIGASARDAIIIMDDKGEVVYWNQGATNILGYEDTEILGKKLHETLAPLKYRPGFQKNLPHFFKTGRGAVVNTTQELEAITKDARIIPIELSVSATRINKRWHAIGIMRDISKWKNIETTLRLDKAVIETAQEGIIVTDRNNNILEVNPSFTEITGYSAEEALNKNPRFLASGNQDKSFYQALWRHLMTSGRWSGQLINRKKTGEIYPVWLSISSIKDANGEIERYIAIFSDISYLKKAEIAAHHQATHDILTSMPNRRAFEDALEQTVLKCDRNHTKAALLFLDLDHFKEVNDQRGHLVGDNLLQQVGKRLVLCTRKSDILARMGGDEFAILITPITSKIAVKKVAEKIVKSLAEDYLIDGEPSSVTVSIGIALYPADASAGNVWLQCADEAMYEVKKSTRNAYKFYSKGT